MTYEKEKISRPPQWNAIPSPELQESMRALIARINSRLAKNQQTGITEVTTIALEVLQGLGEDWIRGVLNERRQIQLTDADAPPARAAIDAIARLVERKKQSPRVRTRKSRASA